MGELLLKHGASNIVAPIQLDEPVDAKAPVEKMESINVTGDSRESSHGPAAGTPEQGSKRLVVMKR